MSASGGPLCVAQLIESLEAGGAEALAIDIASELHNRGHQSHLIVLRGDGPFRNRVPSSVTFLDLDRPRQDGNQLTRVLYFLETCRRLRNILKEREIKVLQTHLPKGNFLGLVMGWRRVCRVFPTVHNNREFDYGDNAGTLKRGLRRNGYHRMLKHCEAMIAVSDQVKESMGKQLNLKSVETDRIRVVPNGVGIPDILTDSERLAHRTDWGMEAGQTLFVGAGRLTRQKNFKDLVSALATMKCSRQQWKCVIAGEGELAPDLERLVKKEGMQDNIILPGLVGDLEGLFAAADVFCLPSIFEGLPLVLLEAMASGLPVVSFAIDGVTDVVTDGVQALLAQPGNVDGFAAHLETLISDSEMRRLMGQAANSLVVDQYGFGRVVDDLESVYHS